jgi:selenocysteine lyase/cysteine desulfurase
MLSRRALFGAAAAGGALTLVGCTEDTPDQSSDAAGKPFNPRDWASVRAQFRLPADRAQLAAFVFASHPAPVRAAIDRHREGLDEDPTGYLNAREAMLDTAVAAGAAHYLETQPEQLAFTDSTTMGLGLLYTGLTLKPGDEILTTEHDFYATHESLRLLAQRSGATIRRVKLYAEPARASVEEIVGNLRGALSTSTRYVAVTWVHSSTGVRLPISAMADVVRQSDALLCVDGVHGVGAVDQSPDALKADFLVSSGHKWLFGPRGTGFVWGSDRGWARYRPVIPPFDNIAIGNWMLGGNQPVAPGVAATPGGYHSFEHRWALADAFAFHAAIGRARVASRTAELAKRLKEGLAAIKGVTVHTPMAAELSAGIVCCALDGIPPGAAVARLRGSKVIASQTPYAQSYLRFGTSVLVNEQDIERTLAAVRAMR